jgi:arylsulfatase
MPTCVEVAGAKYPSKFNGTKIQRMEGVSLMPAFEGKPLKRKSPLFFEHEGNRAVRDGKWKLVSTLKPTEGQWELYDMEIDRTEMHDLSATSPAKAKYLAKKWEQWSKRVGALPWPVKPLNAKGNESAAKGE